MKAAITCETKPPGESTYLAASGAEVTSINIKSLFSRLRKRGVYHRPIFQNLLDSSVSGERAITNFKIAEIACKEHNYMLHPTTLNSILQASFSSLPNDIDSDTIVRPRSIGSIFVPHDPKRQGGDRLRAFTELIKSDKRGYTSNITVIAVDLEDSTNFLQMQDFFGQAVPRSAGDAEEETGICSKSCWELDILHDVPKALKDSMTIPLQQHEIDTERKLVRLSFYLIHDALPELQGQDNETWEWHHKRMYSWMETIIARGKRGELGEGSQSWSKANQGLKKMLADELRARNAAGRLTVRVRESLPKIIRGNIMPLELMMEGNLLNQFYIDHEALNTRSYSDLAKIAELYAVKDPRANVLEIGGGTGGATTTVIEGFGARGDGTGSILGHYTFTDISSGSFEADRKKFAAWSTMMDFKKLDIDGDPFSQGFTAGSYDLIIAASVLHATRSLHRTMSNVRTLLKPGSKILLIGATADRLERQLIFGTLPGWWLREEPERQTSPNAPLEMWDRVLRETDFTGVEFNIADYEETDF